jgi:hypothetical protein
MTAKSVWIGHQIWVPAHWPLAYLFNRRFVFAAPLGVFAVVDVPHEKSGR